MKIQLYDGTAFSPKGTNFTDEQIKNHCSLNEHSPNLASGNYTDKEKEDAKNELISYRTVMTKLAATKLRSRFVDNIQLQGINTYNRIEDVSSEWHGPKPTLKLGKHIFYAIFTVPEATKETLLVTLASDLVSHFDVTFHKETDVANSCIVGLAQEALYTARKVFLKSGRHKNSQMFLSSRTVDEWDGPIDHDVPQFTFAPHKLGGWKKLIEVDPEAEKLYYKHHKRPAEPIPVEKEATKTYAPGNMIQTGLAAIQNGNQGSDTSALVSISGSKTSDCYTKGLAAGMEDYLADPFGNVDVNNRGVKWDEKSTASSVVTMQQWKVPAVQHIPRQSSSYGGHHSANIEGTNNRTATDRSDFLLQLQTGDHTMSDITGSSEVSNLNFLLIIECDNMVSNMCFSCYLSLNPQTMREISTQIEKCRNDMMDCRSTVAGYREDMAGMKEMLKNSTEALSTMAEVSRQQKQLLENNSAVLDALLKSQRLQENALAAEATSNSLRMEAAKKAAKKSKTGGTKRKKQVSPLCLLVLLPRQMKI